MVTCSYEEPEALEEGTPSVQVTGFSLTRLALSKEASWSGCPHAPPALGYVPGLR